MSDWKPIETAPKDGTRLLLWPDETGEITIGWFNGVVAEYTDKQKAREYQEAWLDFLISDDPNRVKPQRPPTDEEDQWLSVENDIDDGMNERKRVFPVKWQRLPEVT